MASLSVDDLNYIAGFLDGEGCFTVINGKIAVCCSNTNKPVIKWLHEKFGGSFISNIRKKKPHHRPMHSWKVVCRDAFKVCCMIAPYLKEKAEQALLLIAIQQTMGKKTKSTPPEIKEERIRLSKLNKELKHVSWC